MFCDAVTFIFPNVKIMYIIEIYQREIIGIANNEIWKEDWSVPCLALFLWSLLHFVLYEYDSLGGALSFYSRFYRVLPCDSIFNILITAYLIVYFVYMLWCLLALTII